MKTVAIIQARMGSTRLPGKVMKQLCGQSVLAHVIHRVQACSLVDEVVVATTVASDDEAIIVEADRCGVKWFRGSEEDVLARYYQAAQQYDADILVRVTSDCPLFDPHVLTLMVNKMSAQHAQGCQLDYLSNTLTRTYPRGLDAEVLTFSALEVAYKQADQPYEREHVTPYIYQHPDMFVLQEHCNGEDLSGYRWTLDTEADWTLIEKIYHALYKDGELFTTADVLTLCKRHPDMLTINADITQKRLGE